MNGMIRTEDSMKNYYKNYQYNSSGFKTYNQLYNDIGLGEQSAIGSANYDYNKAMIDAYKSAQQETDSITASNLLSGVKQELLDNLDIKLLDAYKSYEQNYTTAVSNIEQSADKQRDLVNEELTTQAQNATKLQNSVRDYLRYLWTATSDKEDNMFNNDEWWARLQTEEDGVKRLLTNEELDKLMYDTDKTGTQAYLNMAGVDIYDRLLDSQYLEDESLLNYDSWLLNQSMNEKNDYYGLYDWYSGYNPYDVRSLDEAGLPTNKAFIKTAFGLVSSDNSWTFAERFGGFTEKELSGMFDKYRNYVTELDELVEKKGKDNPKKILDKLDDVINELDEMAYRFGLADDFENDFDKYRNLIKQKRKEITSGGEMAIDWLGEFFGGSLGGAVGGTAIIGGTVVGTPIGAIVGAAIGGTIAIGTGSKKLDDKRKVNKNAAEEAKTSFNNVLTLMINESLRKRKQIELDYKKNNQF